MRFRFYYRPLPARTHDFDDLCTLRVLPVRVMLSTVQLSFRHGARPRSRLLVRPKIDSSHISVSFAAEVFSRIGLRDKKRYDLNYLASAQLRLKYDLLYRNLGVLLHDDGHIR